MRSLLLVSPTDTSTVEAAFAAAPDALVLDMVASGADADARVSLPLRVRDILRAAQLDAHRPHLFLRLANLDALDFDADLATTMSGEPDGILLSGCRTGADVQHLGAKLAVVEAEHGFADGGTTIIAEAAGRAGAMFGLGSYGGASPRLVGLSWDASGLARDLGVPQAAAEARSFAPFETARHLTLFAARAAEVAAVDSASLSQSDEAVEAECRAARRLGFNAKLATRPAEVAIIHAVFGIEEDGG